MRSLGPLSRALLLAVAALLAAPTRPARAAPDPGADARAVDAYLTRASRFGFSGAVLVARGGEVLLEKGYGFACRRDRAPNTPDTLFDIASLAKQFTAALVLRLSVAGRLGLDDPIAKHLDGVPPDKKDITIRHLLHHTSGLDPGIGVRMGTPDRESLVGTVLRSRLEHAPGSTFAYCNAGYMLLAALTERAAGERFESLVRRMLFSPAGLEATYFFDETPPPAARVAHAYEWTGSLGPAHEAVPYGWGLRGAGGVISSVRDLFRWGRALGGGRVLSLRSLETLFSPGLEGYACGWFVSETERGTRLIRHGGTSFGAESMYARFVDEDVTVILLTNRNALRAGRPLEVEKRLLRAIEAILFGGEPPSLPAIEARLSEDALRALTGDFRLESGGRLEVRAGDGILVVSPVGQDALDLLAAVVRGPAPAPRPEVDLGRAMERAGGFAEALVARSLPEAEKFLHPAVPSDFLEKWQVEDWLSREKTWGAAREAEALGAWAQGDGSARTVVRVRFGEEVTYLLVHAVGGEIIALTWSDRDGHPGVLRIVPGGPGRAVYVDLGTGGITPFIFGMGGGRATSLRVLSRTARR